MSRERGHGPNGRKPYICEQQGSVGRQRKTETSILTGNHTFWGEKGPGGKDLSDLLCFHWYHFLIIYLPDLGNTTILIT